MKTPETKDEQADRLREILTRDDSDFSDRDEAAIRAGADALCATRPAPTTTTQEARALAEKARRDLAWQENCDHTTPLCDAVDALAGEVEALRAELATRCVCRFVNGKQVRFCFDHGERSVQRERELRLGATAEETKR